MNNLNEFYKKMYTLFDNKELKKNLIFIETEIAVLKMCRDNDLETTIQNLCLKATVLKNLIEGE